jgi:arabinofuranosyltransferase
LPNTAYAKLGTGIPAGELAWQGLAYLVDSLRRDPLTLVVIGSGVVLGIWRRGVDAALAVGSVLYLGYVIRIGGDFMSGRFLTVPLLVSTIVLARGIQNSIQLRMAAAVVILLGAIGLPRTLLSGATYAGETTPANGIVDERGYYYQRYGLIAPGRQLPQRRWELSERRVRITCGNLGFDGISGGPGLHLIDTCALADPLLARLPAEATARWRIGHFLRQLPTDYEESVTRGGNVLADPATREYYRSIRQITRGRLFSRARLRELVRMNLGQVPRPDWEMYRETRIPEASPHAQGGT